MIYRILYTYSLWTVEVDGGKGMGIVGVGVAARGAEAVHVVLDGVPAPYAYPVIKATQVGILEVGIPTW